MKKFNDYKKKIIVNKNFTEIQRKSCEIIDEYIRRRESRYDGFHWSSSFTKQNKILAAKVFCGFIKGLFPYEQIEPFMRTLKDGNLGRIISNICVEFGFSNISSFSVCPEYFKEMSMKETILLGQGSRGTVYRRNDRVVKMPSNEENIDFSFQLKMFNKWAIRSGYTEAARINKYGVLNMPFRNGKIVEKSEDLKKGVIDLYELGFFIGDPIESNFMKLQNGKVIPVDFDLIFDGEIPENIDDSFENIDDSFENIDDSFENFAYQYLKDYIKGGGQLIQQILYDQLKKDYRNVAYKLMKTCHRINPNVIDMKEAGL